MKKRPHHFSDQSRFFFFCPADKHIIQTHVVRLITSSSWRMLLVTSPQRRLESCTGAHAWVSQSSLRHLTKSPSMHFSDVTSSLLHSRPHSRNREIRPDRPVKGKTSTFPSTSLWAAPRVSVPLGASLQHEEEVEGGPSPL